MRDSSYFEKRAIEAIHEAEVDRITALGAEMDKDIVRFTESNARYHNRLIKAMQLLALARIVEL